ncbi:SPOR domain-containing protein [Catenovulum sp. SM1970]|uniref:SPOR domain-containing protein n=1 Tax=Marinifaba aquimaris TaxID=2741323 RepID=UPI0015749092|nr:SPOR domain-containing protein [Marinifaba aquimaris]NTS77704.1 SPOR domain-containing protein [Marinifaba aquimaris]
MSRAYSNRLVGSIVVIALVVIFLPNLLDGKKVSHQQSFQEIPSKPEFVEPKNNIKFNESQYQSEIAQAQEVVSDEMPIDEVLDATEKVQESATAKTDIEILPEEKVMVEAKPETRYQRPAWVIQLGSFKNKANVESLVAKLKREGYLVFTRPIKTQAGTLTKVYVGPDLDKQKLDAMIPELNKLTKTSGKLAVYKPGE